LNDLFKPNPRKLQGVDSAIQAMGKVVLLFHAINDLAPSRIGKGERILGHFVLL
jgi:hypothetical protein